MKLVSWNVNGLRACLNKGFLDFVALADADVICLQETKLQPHQVSFELPGYRMYFNSADKAGYSGTAVLTRKEPLNVTYDFGDDEHRHEGRIITAEYEDFYLVCCGAVRPERAERIHKARCEQLSHLPALLVGKAGVEAVCLGVLQVDLLVRHIQIAAVHHRLRLIQRAALWPDRADAYSWWSYRAASRARNVGWRIDYFIVSERLRGHIKKAEIWSEIMGSDHCPVMLELE